MKNIPRLDSYPIKYSKSLIKSTRFFLQGYCSTNGVKRKPFILNTISLSKLIEARSMLKIKNIVDRYPYLIFFFNSWLTYGLLEAVGLCHDSFQPGPLPAWVLGTLVTRPEVGVERYKAQLP